MTIASTIREQARGRAGFACEYCGVTETDAGGELTIDHFCPQSKGGGDELENLVYCCVRCNINKGDYWPASEQPFLWNPRSEDFNAHFLLTVNCEIYPLTATGAFAIQQLRLNRPQLIAYRQRQRQSEAVRQWLEGHQELLAVLDGFTGQHFASIEEQRKLFAEIRDLLTLLLQRNL